MVIDILILGLLLTSFTINLMALGAIYRTPGLRTTANRFVINLLIINLSVCFILASTLVLIRNISATVHTKHSSDYNLDIIREDSVTDHHRLTLHKKRMMLENEVLNTINHRNYSEYFEKLTIKERDKQIVIIHEIIAKKLKHEKMYNKHLVVDPIHKTKNETKKVKAIQYQFLRPWSFDLAAALGALSVLVVVGDTWMAVRDPLRYYSQVSALKAWILITITWALGIVFGVMSAYRQFDFKCSILTGKQRNCQYTETNTVFSTVFAYTYFVVIIILPFGCVCGMYWRIFSEAKENGLRMRKNIISPLLQITTDLSLDQNHNKSSLLENNHLSKNDAPMEISTNKRSLNEKVTKPKDITVSKINPTNRILLNFSSVSEEINENNSLHPFNKKSSQDLILHHIYSTPNLQKYNLGYGSFFTGLETSSNLRCMSLQIRTTNISPKSISYMTWFGQQLSSASSLFKHREESRAARISILVVIMFLVSYLPYGVLVLPYGSQVIKNFSYSTQLTVFMILVANISSAFIFVYRNKRVRHGVTRLFEIACCSRKHSLQKKSIFLRFINKFRKLSKCSMNSSKYLTPNLAYSRKSLENTKYDLNTVEIFLRNSSSIQSSTIIGNIAFCNGSVDLDFQSENAPENVSVLKNFLQKSRNINSFNQYCYPEPIWV